MPGIPTTFDLEKSPRARSEFADSIARLCLEKYECLKKTGKPKDNEWTVLAGIVLMNADNILTPVSLATGTKCLSGARLLDARRRDDGDPLSDSHAEILARRGFLLYLYDQIDLSLATGNSDILVIDESGRIVFKPGISIHFYCSRSPCGDCSIVPMDKGESYDASVSAKKRKLMSTPDVHERGSPLSVYGDSTTMASDIHRTGAKCLAGETKKDPRLPGLDYHVTGPLRTKPGRGDPTLSLSCSDKIAKWNAVGIQGSLLSLFVPFLRLSTIVIGSGCSFSPKAMERGICERFGNVSTDGPNILQASIEFLHMKNSVRSRPCSSSIVWCAVRGRNIEIIVDGRKQGATKNQKGGGLLISRKTFLRKFLETVDKHPLMKNLPMHPKKICYRDCKLWCDSYQKKWKFLKSTKFSPWPEKPSILQDFSL